MAKALPIGAAVWFSSPDALKAGKGKGPKLELIVVNNEFYKTYVLDYHGGEKYAHLVRDESRPDVLSNIIAPLAK